MKTIAQLLRIKSWVKNGFILLPLFFSFKLNDLDAVILSVIGVLVFCLTSSSVYILNDCMDAASDALHPRKKHRPIASGKITKKLAVSIGFLCLLSAFILSLLAHLPMGFIGIISGYFLLNLAYSFGLKQVSLIELMVVAINFVLRVLAGCMVIGVTPSNWILVVTFFLSFLLVSVKRKSELQMLENKAVAHRKVLAGYTVPFLNMLVYIAATVTITAYLLYSIDPKVISTLHTNRLIYSTLFVFLGIIRFIQISEIQAYDGEGDPTTILYKDRFIQATIVGWLIYLFVAIYVG
jgi:4-hydroxybenzoate polyprenyltransferase